MTNRNITFMTYCKLGKYLLIRICLLLLLAIIVQGCSGTGTNNINVSNDEIQRNDGAELFKFRKRCCLISEKSKNLEISFPFQNSTKKILSIDTVKTHCGCTKVKYPKYAIRKSYKDSITLSISIPRERIFFSNTALVYFHGLKPIVLEVIGKRCNK